MSESSATLPHLGIILPDDPIKSEMHALDHWLRDHGRSDVHTTMVLSKMMGGHVAEDLYQTGDLSVIAPPARKLVSRGCGAIVWACTSGSFIGGLEWAKSQQRGMEEAAGVPATSTTLAFLAALEHRGNSKVHVLGAYPEPVTRAFLGCLEADGREIGAWRVSIRRTDRLRSFLTWQPNWTAPWIGCPMMAHRSSSRTRPSTA